MVQATYVFHTRLVEDTPNPNYRFDYSLHRIVMSTERPPYPTTRRRFGFAGVSRKRELDVGPTVDDILDSMNKRTALSQGLEPAESRDFENSTQLSRPWDSRDASTLRKHGTHKAAFLLLAFTSLFALWFTGALYEIFSFQALSQFFESLKAISPYADLAAVGAILVLVLIPVLAWRRSRRQNDVLHVPVTRNW